MKATHNTLSWSTYLKEELRAFGPVFENLGLQADQEQPHIHGERYLMSGNKLVLIGHQTKTGLKVVIKASRDKGGRDEIRHEKHVRDILEKLAFTNDTLLAPREVCFVDTKEHTVLVTEFIEQPQIYVARPLENQFFVALRAFEAQEAFHATTYEHLKSIQKTFTIFTSKEYIRTFSRFTAAAREQGDIETLALLERAGRFLSDHAKEIDRYSNYLVHTDFVPHNMRITDRDVYLLDYTAVQFGNKYEGWARFLNYMLIHNPELEHMLTNYIRVNRPESEYLSLRLMRSYKIGFLLEYYLSALPKTEGNLRALTQKRISFWKHALEAVLNDAPLRRELIDEYINERNALRSHEEKERQKEFAVA